MYWGFLLIIISSTTSADFHLMMILPLLLLLSENCQSRNSGVPNEGASTDRASQYSHGRSMVVELTSTALLAFGSAALPTLPRRWGYGTGHAIERNDLT